MAGLSATTAAYRSASSAARSALASRSAWRSSALPMTISRCRGSKGFV